MGQIAKWGSALAIFAFSFAFASPFAIPKLVVLSVTGVLIASMILNGYEVNLSILGLLILGVCLVSALFAQDRTLAFIGRYNSYAMGLMGLWLVFMFYLASDKQSVELVPLVGAILGIHALAQFAGYDAVLTQKYTLGRAISTIGHPVDLGLILAMCLPFAVCKSRVYALAVVLGLLATGSRGAWIASASGLAMWKVTE